MPRVTLEFNLPEERREYEVTSKANNYYAIIWKFKEEFLRSNIKHYDIENSDLDLKTLEKVRDEFHQLLDHYGFYE